MYLHIVPGHSVFADLLSSNWKGAANAELHFQWGGYGSCFCVIVLFGFSLRGRMCKLNTLYWLCQYNFSIAHALSSTVVWIIKTSIIDLNWILWECPVLILEAMSNFKNVLQFSTGRHSWREEGWVLVWAAGNNFLLRYFIMASALRVARMSWLSAGFSWHSCWWSAIRAQSFFLESWESWCSKSPPLTIKHTENWCRDLPKNTVAVWSANLV